MKLWVLPIEPLEERYSADWLRWWKRELAASGVEHEFVLGERLLHTENIVTGQFLDVHDTNYWKATQLAAFTVRLHGGAVRDNDWVLLHDAWNPCVEQLAYMRDLGSVKFKIAGMFHAGSYDPYDLLGRTAVRRWARVAESGWERIYDRTFFATEFHRTMFLNAYGAVDRSVVAGFPFYGNELRRFKVPWHGRGRLVVFPHRLAPEKQPGVFDHLRDLYLARYGEDGTKWVKTKSSAKSKDSYYHLLAGARVAVSTALQETWGIAMLEAQALGCWPVAPDRLSYGETTATELYRDEHRAVELIHAFLDKSEEYAGPSRYWESSIGRIVKELMP